MLCRVCVCSCLLVACVHCCTSFFFGTMAQEIDVIDNAVLCTVITCLCLSSHFVICFLFFVGLCPPQARGWWMAHPNPPSRVIFFNRSRSSLHKFCVGFGIEDMVSNHVRLIRTVHIGSPTDRVAKSLTGGDQCYREHRHCVEARERDNVSTGTTRLKLSRNWSSWSYNRSLC